MDVQSLKKLAKLNSFQDQESFQRGQVAKKMDKKKTFLRRFGENLFYSLLGSNIFLDNKRVGNERYQSKRSLLFGFQK